MQEVPEALDYINKFHLCGHTLPWNYIDDMPYWDYQLFIVMTNAYANKLKAEQGASGGGNSFMDMGAIGLEGGLEDGV